MLGRVVTLTPVLPLINTCIAPEINTCMALEGHFQVGGVNFC